jgi:hypothetical protein
MLRHFILPSSDPESDVISTTGYLLNISASIPPTIPVLIPPSTMGEYDAKAEAIEDAISRFKYLELFGPHYKVVPITASESPILVPRGKRVLRLVRHEYKPTADVPVTICLGAYHKDMERFTGVNFETRLSEEGPLAPGDAVPIDIGDWTFDPFVHRFPISGRTAANGVRYIELDSTDAKQCWTSQSYISGRVCDQRMRDALRPKSTVSMYNGEWVVLEESIYLPTPAHAIVFWSDSASEPLCSYRERLTEAWCTDVAIIEHVDACYHPVPTNPTFVDFWGRTYSNVTGTLDPASVAYIDQVTELVLDKLRHLPLYMLQCFLSYVPVSIRNRLPASPYKEADAACIHRLTEVLRIELTLNVAHKILNATGVQQ